MSSTTLSYSEKDTNESHIWNGWDDSWSVSTDSWESLSTVSYPDLDELSDDESDHVSENSIKIWKCIFLIKHVRWATELREPKGAELTPVRPRSLAEQLAEQGGIEEPGAQTDLKPYPHTPDEILLKIISYVKDDHVTFFCLRQVSRRFRALVSAADFQDHFLSTHHGCKTCNNADMCCSTYQRIGIDEKTRWGIRRRPALRSEIRAVLRRDHLCWACQRDGLVFPVGLTCGCEDEEFLELDDGPLYGEYYGYDEFSENYTSGNDYEYDSGCERYALHGEDRHEPR